MLLRNTISKYVLKTYLKTCLRHKKLISQIFNMGQLGPHSNVTLANESSAIALLACELASKLFVG